MFSAASGGGREAGVWAVLGLSVGQLVLTTPLISSLCTTGVVRLHINNWLEVSFCLPHKIHSVASRFIPPEAIERSLKAIR